MLHEVLLNFLSVHVYVRVRVCVRACASVKERECVSIIVREAAMSLCV